MKLYGHPLSPCTRKPLLVAAEKRAPLEFVHVDLFTGAHHTPEHQARHPFGLIPVLDDGGFLLYESRAIAKYLDAALPGTSLTPASARDRARMEQWLSCDHSYVAPHTSALAQQRVVRPHLGVATEDAAVTAAEQSLAKTFAVFDHALATAPFLAGDAISLADVSLATYAASLPLLKATHLLEPVPHLRRWWHDVSARPGWELLG